MTQSTRKTETITVPLSADDFRAVAAAAREQIASTEGEIEQLRDSVTASSIEIFQGGAAAKAKSEAARKRLGELEVDLTISRQALIAAERKVDELLELEKSNDKARRKAEAESLAAQLLMKSEEIDMIAGVLRQAFAARRELAINIQSLIQSDVAQPGLFKRFYSDGPTSGALVHADLDRYIEMPRGYASTRIAMAEYDKTLIAGIGLAVREPGGSKQ